MGRWNGPSRGKMADWDLQVVEEDAGDVCVVTMNVNKHNVLSIANMEAMERALDRIESEEQFEDMGVVLAVKGGAKSFSAGLDLQYVVGLTEENFIGYVDRFDRLM